MSDLDEDGYPTNETLDRIKKWPANDFHGLMSYIESLWFFPEYFNKGPTLNILNERVTEYRLSTGGWSGNEDIIRALTENAVIHTCYWWSSRRGGHYVYRAP